MYLFNDLSGLHMNAFNKDTQYKYKYNPDIIRTTKNIYSRPVIFQFHYLLFILTGDVDVLCAVVERNVSRAAAQDRAL